MEYRNVGSSGLKISAVSIGGWITFGGTIDDDVTASILKTAFDNGINFVDLADVYARGKAEQAAGKALRDLPRHELVISSKVFGRMSDDPNDAGLSRKHIVESIERSLRNLGTDYLDIYFCHREDPETPLAETVRAMDDLITQGKVLYWGTSVWPATSLQRAHDLADMRGQLAPTVEQPEYSLIERGVEAEVLPRTAALGMGVVAWSPLAGGMLTGKYNDGVPVGSRADTTDWMEGKLTDENVRRARAFTGIAEEMGVAPNQLALAWVLRRPELSSVITGASRPEHVESNVKAVDVVIPPEVLVRLDELFPG